MKIYSLCTVKNETDILPRVVEDALGWSDRVILIDNGSTDGTHEAAAVLAERYEKVSYLCRYYGSFLEGLRALGYHAFRSELTSGKDWWCRLDADEIYIDDPRAFLSDVPAYCRSVDSQSFNYMFTEHDINAYAEDPDLYENGACADTLRYYVCNYGETRFLRHGDYLWDLTRNYSGWPRVGAMYPKHRSRIRLKHLQYRYPAQIQARMETRHLTWSQTGLFSHETDEHEKFFKVKSRDDADRIVSRLRSDRFPSASDWLQRVKSSEHLFDVIRDGHNRGLLRSVHPYPLQGMVFARDMIESRLPVRLPRRRR